MIDYNLTEKQLQKEQLLMKKQSITYAAMRLTSIGLFFLFLYLTQQNSIFYVFVFIFFILFLILVYVHEKLKEHLLFKETKLEILKKLENRCNEDWKKEEKVEYQEEDSMLNDLDIVGQSSLINYINMSGTPLGNEYLTGLFKNESSYDEVLKRQYAIQDLLNKPDILLDLQTYCALFKKHSKKIKKENMKQLMNNIKIIMTLPRFMYFISIILVMTTLIFTALSVFFYDAIQYLFILVSINIIFVLVNFTKNNSTIAEIASVKDVLEDYQDIMVYYDKIEWETPYLKLIQTENKKGIIGLRSLLSISGLTRLRSNLITNLIFNGLFQLDYILVYKLSKWKQRYANSLENWLFKIAEIESLLSFSVLGQVKKDYCFPHILDEKNPSLSFQNLYHPLIDEEKVIANSLTLANDTFIITGSNMSGKTTFLRALGVNSKLALLGAPVCAEKFEISLMTIYTSMRVKDDVNEGISTFYAELLSIKKMMDATKKEQPMMVLIDEIFKGTNSVDRIYCAKEAICKLHLPWVITLVSTHDFELCSLAEDKKIQAKNYHFEEYYKQNEIHFDYLLKSGKCTTTNAKELMRMAGF